MGKEHFSIFRKIKMPKLSLSPNGPTKFSQLLTNHQRSIPLDTIAWDRRERLVNVTTVLYRADPACFSAWAKLP